METQLLAHLHQEVLGHTATEPPPRQDQEAVAALHRQPHQEVSGLMALQHLARQRPLDLVAWLHRPPQGCLAGECDLQRHLRVSREWQHLAHRLQLGLALVLLHLPLQEGFLEGVKFRHRRLRPSLGLVSRRSLLFQPHRLQPSWESAKRRRPARRHHRPQPCLVHPQRRKLQHHRLRLALLKRQQGFLGVDRHRNAQFLHHKRPPSLVIHQPQGPVAYLRSKHQNQGSC
mmetsp:Transcript_54857/g.132278  ORF Transcript_54857/g.132278 Transcript_54857/m.132278 type:complete len:230 (-) Transcript_54857:580-1269(-)